MTEDLGDRRHHGNAHECPNSHRPMGLCLTAAEADGVASGTLMVFTKPQPAVLIQLGEIKPASTGVGGVEWYPR